MPPRIRAYDAPQYDQFHDVLSFASGQDSIHIEPLPSSINVMFAILSPVSH